ncbi:MAG TPA: penicillin-binding transpeptidase domain-containing protein, partial [Acidimicrobiales bacterium]|nr:penicillin-binding transpeptidase domain-containing protein [Acidimicrobiales bacterium]
DVAGTYFHDAETHGTETMSAAEVLAQSSNIGTIEIAEKLGKDRVDQYMRSFGFGEPTGIGFPGASSGILVPVDRWSGTTIGSDPIGQDAAVTALQIADAYNVIANDGVFVPPRLVDATIGKDGKHSPVATPPAHRTLTPQISAELRGMLEQVVAAGTGTEAVVPGYTVAGKTGTAQIPNPNASGYLPGQFMATFAGFVPAQNPALTIVVSFQSPQTSIYGGSVAAPVFAQIARYSLQLLNIPPPADEGGGTLSMSATGSTPTTSSNLSAPVTPTTVPLSSDVTGG